MSNSAMRVRGFTIYNAISKTSEEQMLNVSLVHSILESGSVKWCPSDAPYSNDVEKVKKKLMRYRRPLGTILHCILLIPLLKCWDLIV